MSCIFDVFLTLMGWDPLAHVMSFEGEQDTHSERQKVDRTEIIVEMVKSDGYRPYPNPGLISPAEEQVIARITKRWKNAAKRMSNSNARDWTPLPIKMDIQGKKDLGGLHPCEIPEYLPYGIKLIG